MGGQFVRERPLTAMALRKLPSMFPKPLHLGVAQMYRDHLRVVKLLLRRLVVNLCLQRLLLQLLPMKAGGVLKRITALLSTIIVESRLVGPVPSGTNGKKAGDNKDGRIKIGRDRNVVKVRETDRTLLRQIVAGAPTKAKAVARLKVRKVLMEPIVAERVTPRRMRRYPLSPSLV